MASPPPRNHGKRRSEKLALAKLSRRVVGPGPIPVWLTMTREEADVHHRLIEDAYTERIRLEALTDQPPAVPPAPSRLYLNRAARAQFHGPLIELLTRRERAGLPPLLPLGATDAYP